MPSLRTPDGRTLTWTESGSGPLLLCHCGGPGLASAYFGGLPDLARERTLLLLDPRGTGASDRPADPHAYDLADYAADVEAVREHLGLERIDLLGHSHGGFVAMAWATVFPDRVGRLVLSNTAARFTDAIREARQAIVAGFAGEPWFGDALAALEAHQAGRYADDAELAALFEREAPFLMGAWGEEEQELGRSLAKAGTNADALRHFNDHVAGAMDFRAGLARVLAPTLVITGSLDPFGESTAREIADALPNAELVLIPGARHFAFAGANHAAWARAVLDFLAAG